MPATPVTSEPARGDAALRASTSGPVAILAALPEELGALRGRLGPLGTRQVGAIRVLTGWLGGRPVILAATGDGAARAARNAATILDRLGAARLLIVGIAGGLSPGLRSGDLLVARRVVDLGDSAPLPQPDSTWVDQALAVGGTAALLISSPTILVTARQKAAVYASLPGGSVAAVDLESAALAREAGRRRIPYLVLRAVSDPAEESLPMDFEGLRNREGGVSRPRVLLHALAQPSLMSSLLMLRRRLKDCAEALARMIPAVVREDAP